MTEAEIFLQDAAKLAGVDTQRLLAQVLHVGDGVFESFARGMKSELRTLALRLDRELRVRNPGLHYVERKMFLGYRREGASTSHTGERSQIFASLIRNNTRLEVVLPVDPATAIGMPNARDLRGTGHHGVGDLRLSVSDSDELDQLLQAFHYWLTPSPA